MNCGHQNNSPLPYRDTKAQGAADFYFAIHATFRYLLETQESGTWEQYLNDLGEQYFAPVNQQWRAGGLHAVAEYWHAFFNAEPQADVTVTELEDTVSIQVHRCPALHHLKTHGRQILSQYCQHCFYLGQARASQAGMAMRLEGGNGSCCHTYHANPAQVSPQSIEAITPVIF